jgi:hypothetical protein
MPEFGFAWADNFRGQGLTAIWLKPSALSIKFRGMVVGKMTGCLATASPQDLAQQDDATCRSYGAVPGSDAYVNCRMQRDSTRQQGEALRRATIIASPN